MGVIDLDARVKKLEQGSGGADPTVIDQLEAAVTALEEAAVPVKTPVTELTHGTAYSDYGGVFYEHLGNIVHVHVAVSGLTAFSSTVIFTLPEAVRPESGDTPIAFGTGSATFGEQSAFVLSKILASPINGNVTVESAGTYAIVDLWYMIGHSTT